jgi:hypothetical protein
MAVPPRIGGTSVRCSRPLLYPSLSTMQSLTPHASRAQGRFTAGRASPHAQQKRCACALRTLFEGPASPRHISLPVPLGCQARRTPDPYQLRKGRRCTKAPAGHRLRPTWCGSSRSCEPGFARRAFGPPQQETLRQPRSFISPPPRAVCRMPAANGSGKDRAALSPGPAMPGGGT